VGFGDDDFPPPDREGRHGMSDALIAEVVGVWLLWCAFLIVPAAFVLIVGLWDWE